MKMATEPFNSGVALTKAYFVGNIKITHAESYSEYQKHVPQTISDFGGRYLVRGGMTTQLEGDSLGGRNVVLEFPSREQAEAWYQSDAYQSIIHLRKNNSTGTLLLVDGYSLS
jgi:uncharacterized protein (DUF1330 family)